MKEGARLALSIGCPAGIGPEVSVVAASGAEVRVLLVGDLRALELAAVSRGIDPARLVRVRAPRDAWSLPRGKLPVLQPSSPLAAADRRAGSPTRLSGAAELAWIDAACDLTAHEECDAMVTGPVSKEAIVRSRAPGSANFLGHTEHLQRRLAAREVVMAFWTSKLTTALVTTHLPLSKVPRAITPAAVARASFWLASLLADLGSLDAPIAVTGLNPHAGESGLLGKEETERIVPGMIAARERLINAGISAELLGPVPAESAFRLAVGGKFAGVVAMYHDQATIPMKLVGFGEAVNVSLGLPIVRTSVDHGTAYDLAGRGVADARGMVEAIALAARISGARRRTPSTRSKSRTSRAPSR